MSGEFYHFDIGNVITWAVAVIGFSLSAGKFLQKLSDNEKASQSRFQENKKANEDTAETVKELKLDFSKLNEFGGPVVKMLESRINALEIQVAALQCENKQIARMSTDMDWMKASLVALCKKFDVIPEPPTLHA